MFIKKNPVSMDILASGQLFPDALTRESRNIGEKVEDDIPEHVDTAIRKCSQCLEARPILVLVLVLGGLTWIIYTSQASLPCLL